MYGDFPAKDTVYTPYILEFYWYIPINVWFWPTLVMVPRAVLRSIKLSSTMNNKVGASALRVATQIKTPWIKSQSASDQASFRLVSTNPC
jgi:hypothetical protein